jgi:hypothetical protein
MSVTSSSTVVGVFGNRAVAEQAMDALAAAGFERDNMHAIVPGSSPGFFEELKSFFTGTEPTPDTDEDKLVRNLMGMGLSNEQARYYSQAYTQGYTLLTVQAPGREQDVLAVLHQYGATQQQVASTAVPGSYEESAYANYAPDWASQETEQHQAVSSQPAMTTPQSETEASSVAPLTPRYGLDTPETQTDEDTSQKASVYPENYDRTLTHPEGYSGNTSTYSENSAQMPYSTDTSQEEKVDEDQEQQTPVYQNPTYQTPGQGTTDEDETPVYQNSTYQATDQDMNRQTETPEVQASTYHTSEQDMTDDETETPVYQNSTYQATDQDMTDESETPENQARVQNPEPSAYKPPEQLNEDAMATYQANETATPAYSNVSQDNNMYPTGVDTPEQSDMVETPAYQQNVGSSQTNTAAQDHEARLQQLREQVRSTQQQLQDTKAQLEKARQHESEYQEVQRQLQELKTELDSTHQELQQTRERIAQYHL